MEIDKVKIEKLQINFGVSQGSILGPFLFLFNFFDLLRSIEIDRAIAIFSDDTFVKTGPWNKRYLQTDLDRTKQMVFPTTYCR